MNSEILFGQIRVKTLLFCLLGIGFYVIRVETRCIHLAPRAPRRNDRLWRGHCCLLSDECFWIFCPRCITRIVVDSTGLSRHALWKQGKVAWNYFTKLICLFYIHGSLNWLISPIYIQFSDFYLLFYFIYIIIRHRLTRYVYMFTFNQVSKRCDITL